MTDIAVEPAAERPAAVFVNPPLGRSIVLGLLSGHLFGTWWIYRNWRYLQQRDGGKVQPFGRAFFSVFFIYQTLEAVKHDPVASERAQASYSSGLLAAGWIVTSVIVNVCSRFPVGPGWTLVGNAMLVGSIFFLLPALLHIRRVNATPEETAPDEPWTWGQWVLAIVGVLIWFGILANVLALCGLTAAA